MNGQNKRDITLVTGFSGAGMTSVLKALEDLGYEVFDNFPLNLVDALLEDAADDPEPIAIGIDTRTRGFETRAVLETAKALQARLLFVVCEDDELQRRFTETRRRHPLAEDKPVHVGIAQEHELLDEIQSKADIVIDTTKLSVHDLRHKLEGFFEGASDKTMTVTLMSFGFKHGLPREADIVMNVQFVDNPHWIPALKPLSGKDQKVGEHIERDPDYPAFLENFQTMIAPLLKRYAQAGKKYLSIAVGCTGGRHRSVYTVEKLAAWLKGYDAGTPLSVYVEHRDL